MARDGDLVDAGMQAIADAYASRTMMGGPGASLEVDVSLAAQVGRLVSVLEARARWEQALADACHPFEFPAANMNLTTNVEDNPEKWAPKDGYAWDVKNLVAAGFTAGTVTVYKSSMGQATPANQRFVFTVPGNWNPTGQALLLLPGQRLTFISAGIAGNVTLSGDGIQVSLPYLAAYLM